MTDAAGAPEANRNCLADISKWIRDFGHDPRNMQRLIPMGFLWHQLWTALDIIDDVELTIIAYLHNHFPTDPGEQYLRVYGVLQALFVQQDALSHLVEALRPAMVISPVDVLKDIRETRNASIGHPTELRRKGDVSAHLISRAGIKKEGFDLISFSDKSGNSIRHVPVIDLIEKQRAEAIRLLGEVVSELSQEEEEHKAKFRGKSLKVAFHLVLYAFEKISEDLRQDSIARMGAWGADQLQDSLDQFEELLKERGLNLDTYDSIKFQYDEIQYPLGELRKFFGGVPSEIASHKAAMVYADALRGSFSHLEQMAGELDEEYAELKES